MNQGHRIGPLVAGLAGVLSALSAPAAAHHSTAAYDHTRKISLNGSVNEFQWTNPHSWIQLQTSDGQGRTTVWAIEFGNPLINLRHGWKRTDVKPGDRVSVVIYPARDGSAHGTLATITLADGRTLDGAADFVPREVLNRAQALPGNRP